MTTPTTERPPRRPSARQPRAHLSLPDAIRAAAGDLWTSRRRWLAPAAGVAAVQVAASLLAFDAPPRLDVSLLPSLAAAAATALFAAWFIRLARRTAPPRRSAGSLPARAANYFIATNLATLLMVAPVALLGGTLLANCEWGARDLACVGTSPALLLAAVAGSIVALYAAVRLAVAGVGATERPNALQGVRLSWALTRGRVWSTALFLLGAGSVVAVVNAVVGIVAAGVVGLAAGTLGLTRSAVEAAIAAPFAAAMTAPLALTLSVVLYERLVVASKG
jgi:hypothetical protein